MRARKTRTFQSQRTSGQHEAVTAMASQNDDARQTMHADGTVNTLRLQVSAIFSSAQASKAHHYGNISSLRKIQESCIRNSPGALRNKDPSHSSHIPNEHDFNSEFVRCLIRILPIRKSEPVGDRLIEFIRDFLVHAVHKDIDFECSRDAHILVTHDSSTDKLTNLILETLIPLLSAKERTVRLRTSQIIGYMVSNLNSLNDQVFNSLQNALTNRVNDKEALVRLYAVCGLSRLASGARDPEGDNETYLGASDADSGTADRRKVLDRLLYSLQHDSSAELRRNLLVNLPIDQDSLPFILERARDEDTAIRRSLYARLLPTLGDFRHLSLTHREKLLRWGLRDREESVRKAAARLFRDRWIQDCVDSASTAHDLTETAENVGRTQKPPSLDALLELLERIDVVNSGTQGGIAQTAMQVFWDGRQDYVKYISFPDSFWDNLTPELGFVARTFNDYCRASNQQNLHRTLEEKFPEVTKLAFLLQRELQKLLILMKTDAMDEQWEEECADVEFVVEQMLHIAKTLDYSDEVGRQRMFALTREILAISDLPEESTRLSIEVLCLVCGKDPRGEREFCGVVVEAIAEVHDAIMPEEVEDKDSSIEESFHSAATDVRLPSGSALAGEEVTHRSNILTSSMRPPKGDEIIREIMINMKCLHIALCMLENIDCNIEDNVQLVTMLNNLIVPAVRSQEAPIRERGLCCLGLCCLLSENLAAQNVGLFLHCYTRGHPALQRIALQVLSDIVMKHPTIVSSANGAGGRPSESTGTADKILKAFQTALASDDAGVQTIAAVGLAKAMLGKFIIDHSLLSQLVICYFDPGTSTNIEMRQALAYFLPIYCYSHVDNAYRMLDVIHPVIHKLITMRDEYLENPSIATSEAATMAAQSTNADSIASILVDWVDPRRSVGSSLSSSKDGRHADDLHYLLLQATLDRLLTIHAEKAERKTLLLMLTKLHLPEIDRGLGRLSAAVHTLDSIRDAEIFFDVSSRNTLNKLRLQLVQLSDRIAESTERESTAGRGEYQLSNPLVSHSAHQQVDFVGSDELSGSSTGGPDDEGTRVVF